MSERRLPREEMDRLDKSFWSTIEGERRLWTDHHPEQLGEKAQRANPPKR